MDQESQVRAGGDGRPLGLELGLPDSGPIAAAPARQPLALIHELNRSLFLVLQLLAADSFAAIVKNKVLSNSEVAEHILPWTLKALSKPLSEEEFDAWSSLLVDLVPCLEGRACNEATGFAVSKCDGSSATHDRVLASRLIGQLCRQLTREEFMQKLFPKAVSMCQDTEYQVRMTMAQQLPAIAKAVGKESTKASLIDEVAELLADEEMLVRVAGFTSFVGMLEHMPSDALKAVAMPLVRKHMQPLELDIAMQRCIASLFGGIIAGVRVVHLLAGGTAADNMCSPLEPNKCSAAGTPGGSLHVVLWATHRCQ